MKKYLKNLLLSLMCIVVITTLIPASQIAKAATRYTAVDSNNVSWTYTLYAGNATDVRLASNVSGQLNVPYFLDGYLVTSASGYKSGNNVYTFLMNYGANVTSVVFPFTLLEIGDYALYNRDKITSVYIPEGVTKIGYMAFYSMGALKSIDLPSTLTTLGYSALGNSSLTTLKIPGNITSWGDYYNKYSTSDVYLQRLCISSASLTTVEIEPGITVIPQAMFYNCKALKSISIPYSVTSIEDNAFNNCTYLSQIIIPSSVTNIGKLAFNLCDGMGKIFILNPDATIYDSKQTISTASIIYGYSGSTAESYALKYNRTFIPLG
ncbi:leucine-rich repeat domain-containing protein [Anaerocolumna sp. AGMB13020]|uniref:leucine-rich repeat domain-containing protein n=1 Tax=Anaerocolumna sp. AGMB13020 TaxID=3081750 RepID=UPI00295544D5|nr:leucine-rich repeat domain-containing protein [Anaerocolumna sp. AGMB13020]WOO34724.1 leucine-rich repeat domain-containing protein [Anaerocolumna sp. AGMB13020]